MTQEELSEILSQVWMRDWSADDGFDAIWGECFLGETVQADERRTHTEVTPSTPNLHDHSSNELPSPKVRELTGYIEEGRLGGRASPSDPSEIQRLNSIIKELREENQKLKNALELYIKLKDPHREAVEAALQSPPQQGK